MKPTPSSGGGQPPDDARPAREPADTALFRTADPKDLPALVRLENAAFTVDRFSRRVLLYLMTKARATFSVCESGGTIVGYFVVLLPGIPRLAGSIPWPSIRVTRGPDLAPVCCARRRRRQLSPMDGRSCASRCAPTTRPPSPSTGERDIARSDPSGAITRTAATPSAWRRRWPAANQPEFSRIPFYAQTLEFTCGAAALMMAMKALDPSQHLDRQLELRLWREANTIFMMAGHGGCGPVGLALAAQRRGSAHRSSSATRARCSSTWSAAPKSARSCNWSTRTSAARPGKSACRFRHRHRRESNC